MLKISNVIAKCQVCSFQGKTKRIFYYHLHLCVKLTTNSGKMSISESFFDREGVMLVLNRDADACRKMFALLVNLRGPSLLLGRSFSANGKGVEGEVVAKELTTDIIPTIHFRCF